MNPLFCPKSYQIILIKKGRIEGQMAGAALILLGIDDGFQTAVFFSTL
jgi:hypothetical protein